MTFKKIKQKFLCDNSVLDINLRHIELQSSGKRHTYEKDSPILSNMDRFNVEIFISHLQRKIRETGNASRVFW